MIADWRLELMGKTIMEEIWINRKESVRLACQLIKECQQSSKPKKVNLTGIATQLDRLKRKKNLLLEMRTDGEITKEEYLEQKAKIEASISELTLEYESKQSEIAVSTSPDLCWDEIAAVLDQLIDFSGDTLDRDILRKFVSKIIPESKTHFRWYLNLDGRDETIQDVVIEGRKNNAVVVLGAEGENPPLHTGPFVYSNDLARLLQQKKYSLLPTLHRLPSRANLSISDFPQ